MRSTLFFVPHEIGGIPLFGVGLLLGLIAAGLIGWVLWHSVRKRPAAEMMGGIPIFLIAAAIVTFVFPAIEQSWPDGTPIGLPIRGYGVMVLLGLLAGIGITVFRGKQLGIEPDTIVGLGFWMMLTGVIGARAFYVIQKWESFDSIGEIFQVTEGGLVIYGGVIGGIVACVVYCWRNGLKVTAVGDLVAPGFLIGQAFGRIGCLLHGCCFGGVCDGGYPAIQFPAGSGPYQAQVVTGELLGIQIEGRELPQKITGVAPDSPAARIGIEVGDQLERIAFEPVAARPGSDPTRSPKIYVEATIGGRIYPFNPGAMPEASLPTHPSQIYSAINAFLLCLLIWKLQPIPKHDGIVFCIAILLYVSARFVLEFVRNDEAPLFGTGLTIAQLISLGTAVVMVLGIFWLRRFPPGRCWDWEGGSAKSARHA